MFVFVQKQLENFSQIILQTEQLENFSELQVFKVKSVKNKKRPILWPTSSGVLAWRVLWTGEPGGLLSVGSRRVWHDWSDLACMHALEKEMATHPSSPAWRIPGTEEPGWLPSMGSHRVGHDWSDLAAAANLTFITGSHHPPYLYYTTLAEAE